MIRKPAILVIAAVALVVAIAIAVLFIQKNRQETDRIARQAQAAPEAAAAAAAPAPTSPEAAARQEIACVDRAISGAIPEGVSANEMLAECERKTEEALQAIARPPSEQERR